MLINRIERVIYTWNHKKAFLKLEKKITGKNTIRGYLHDVEKLILYPIIGVRLTSIFHNKRSRHHKRSKTNKDYLHKFLDWECARFTKDDKKLNAYDTLFTYYPKLEGIMLPIIKHYGLAYSLKKFRVGNFVSEIMTNDLNLSVWLAENDERIITEVDFKSNEIRIKNCPFAINIDNVMNIIEVIN